MRASVVSGLKPHHKLFFKMKLVATDFNVISTMKKMFNRLLVPFI